jgi:endoglucanase
MIIAKKNLVLLAATLAAFVLNACNQQQAERAQRVAASGAGVNVDVTTTNFWSTGFNGALRISNAAFSSTINSYEVTFKLAGNASVAANAWVGTISAPDAAGNRVASGPSWLAPIARGSSFEQGFPGGGTFSGSSIVGLKVNGQTIALGSGGGGGDTVVPTVSLSSSASNVTVASSITLTATASDNVGIAKVEFYDGTGLLGTDATAPYTQSVALTSAKNGTRSYTAKAFDAAGNTKTSSALSVNVNITVVTPPANGLYVDPNSSPASWANSNPGDFKANLIKTKIASQPMARWFTSTAGVTGVAPFVNAAATVGKIPVMVAYNIPGRDCGQFSSGGAGSPEAYKSWIDSFAAGIGNHKAIVILEPDALPLVSQCAGGTQNEASVTGLLSYGVNAFKTASPNARIYLDIGHSAWLSTAKAASLLNASGISNAAGFSMNTSNYQTTANTTAYGNAISSATGGAHFVMDTSRNGVGPDAANNWCNPAGRKVGNTPQAVNAGTLDYYLWIKVPGESDGNCGIGTGSSAGQFLPQVAYDQAN